MTLTAIQALSRYFATGDSSDSNFSDADILRQSNTNYRKLVAMSLKAVGNWTLGGSSTATKNIAAATRTVTLPTTFLRLKGVDFLYPSNAQDYVKGEQLDMASFGPRGRDDYTTPTPRYFLHGSTLEFWLPHKTANIEAVTSGIKIYYEDEITALASSGDETILPEFANRPLCLMNAIDYCMVNEHGNKLTFLKRELGEVAVDGLTASGELGIFLNFLKGRSEDKRQSIGTRREDYGQAAAGGSIGPRSANFS